MIEETKESTMFSEDEDITEAYEEWEALQGKSIAEILELDDMSDEWMSKQYDRARDILMRVGMPGISRMLTNFARLHPGIMGAKADDVVDLMLILFTVGFLKGAQEYEQRA